MSRWWLAVTKKLEFPVFGSAIPSIHKSFLSAPELGHMTEEAELRAEFIAAFEDAEYPVTGQMDLVPALPKGPRTTFEAGDLTFSVMELATKLGTHADFPYDDVESLVDDIMEALRDEGEL
jgi:hypothetical protein